MDNIRTIAVKYGPRVAAATTAGFALASQAAVDAGVTTALTDAKADAMVVGGAILVVLVAIAAFKFLRKAL